MRQVDHSSVREPSPLVNVSAEEQEQVRTTGEASPKIYRHEEVVDRLQDLYLEKCFLCENRIEMDGEVEHFWPVHRLRPERAYRWKNLHWSCPYCQFRKHNSRYELRSDGAPDAPVEDILLIDPSDPPFHHRVEELLTFDAVTLKACAIGRYQKKPVVTGTVEFLNGPAWENRWTWYERFKDDVNNAHCLAEWRRLRLQMTLDPVGLPQHCFERRVNVLDKANDIYRKYLADEQPFSAAIGIALEKQFRLSVADFRRFSEAFQAYWQFLQNQPPSPSTSPHSPPQEPLGGSTPQLPFNIQEVGVLQMGTQIFTQGSAIVSIGSTITNSKQIIQALPSLRTEEKSQLTELAEEFERQVNKLQETHAAEAALLGKRLEEVLEALNRPKDEHSKPLLRMTVDGLKSAAHAVKEIVPDVLSAANQIALFLIGQG